MKITSKGKGTNKGWVKKTAGSLCALVRLFYSFREFLAICHLQTGQEIPYTQREGGIKLTKFIKLRCIFAGARHGLQTKVYFACVGLVSGQSSFP